MASKRRAKEQNEHRSLIAVAYFVERCLPCTARAFAGRMGYHKGMNQHYEPAQLGMTRLNYLATLGYLRKVGIGDRRAHNHMRRVSVPLYKAFVFELTELGVYRLFNYDFEYPTES